RRHTRSKRDWSSDVCSADLKGASVFVSDLIRNIDLDVKIDFMSVSSYGNSTESSGTVKILKDLDMDIKDKNVLVVEDIIDSGLKIGRASCRERDVINNSSDL